MYIDEILVYLTVAAVSGLAIAMVIRGWNRPFFRPVRKKANAASSPYPAPIWGFRCRRLAR